MYVTISFCFSFVSPKLKQMSDAAEVMKNLKRVPGVNYPVIIPNIKGYNTAVRIYIHTEKICLRSDIVVTYEMDFI